jgi:hypothetical protein
VQKIRVNESCTMTDLIALKCGLFLSEVLKWPSERQKVFQEAMHEFEESLAFTEKLIEKGAKLSSKTLEPTKLNLPSQKVPNYEFFNAQAKNSRPQNNEVINRTGIGGAISETFLVFLGFVTMVALLLVFFG